MASPKKGPSAPADDKTTTNPHTFVLDILIRILQLLLSLTILVTIHELGHYLASKAFGARVDKFYIFFNPRFSLFKKKIGETEYGIGWLPLGGYCKIAGMVDESMDTEALKSEPQPWEYRSKPAWQRLIIIVAGVVMNVLLAWFIYSMMTYKYGETYIATRDVKDGIAITDSTLASTIGLRPGDRIVSVSGTPVPFFDQAKEVLRSHASGEVLLEVHRADTTLFLGAKVSPQGLLGIINDLSPTVVSEWKAFLDKELDSPRYGKTVRIFRGAGTGRGRYRREDRQLLGPGQETGQSRKRRVQERGQRHHDGQPLPARVGLDGFLATDSLSVHHAGGDQHPADPGFGRRTRRLYPLRDDHPEAAFGKGPRMGTNGRLRHPDPDHGAGLRQRHPAAVPITFSGCLPRFPALK